MYKHVFGPVPSRRLGISLGVDLVVSKSCNLNCIFCECGATKKIQLERKRFKDMNEILEEISAVLKDIKPDYITFSGSGEPTLSLDLGNISKAIKEDLKYEGKICLITNSLLLADENLMKELEYIDLIVPTLNTLTQDIFEKIVRPDYRTSVEEIRKGFINLNNSKYKGKIWIEIFILENINDSDKNFVDIANFLKSENIRYDKIQLNTIDRVGAERDLKAISFEKISRAKKILEENGLDNIEIIKSLGELEEDKKIQVNQELLDNMKQKRLYQEEEINKIFKKN
ncbi:radical SAM protein [Fusobacterium periodonticum]|jgi:Fe-S oxidoreductase|uniref:Radical SAM protein n=1 Tax=Fusobacterium pseudoperiodonticum TaxID=2663009 RepID=A0AAD0F0P9_9FUSO|nr:MULTISPECIES: radical SAM protein [Fusobacterium]ATV36294.1 radical SAM protein [Fusobacterium pseudoperiodonticum]ATV60801.1 radical SAM protein [Fusobacterium pseudoperiodonticum]VTX91859.1 Dual-specificity RNA methyltransferase RlmN [Fusobacterium periodonticum]